MFLLVVLWVLKNRPLYCYKRRVNVWFRGTTLVDLLRNNKSTSIKITHKLRKRLLNVHLFVIRSALQFDILLLGFHSVPARWRKYSNLLSSSLTLFYSVVVWNHNIRFEKNCQQKNYHRILIWFFFLRKVAINRSFSHFLIQFMPRPRSVARGRLGRLQPAWLWCRADDWGCSSTAVSHALLSISRCVGLSSRRCRPKRRFWCFF